MARKFLTAIDLAKNELQNAVVQNLASAPSSPVKGLLYFDTTGNLLYWYNGTTWVVATGSGSISYGVITAETAFGGTKTDGVATTVARSDHGHGTPTHDAAAHSAIPISALAAATADISMATHRIVSVLVDGGSSPNDAVTKAYVDNLVAGLSWKETCRVASTANVASLSTLQTIDGVTLAANDRVLLKDQSTGSQNGIYLAQSGGWTRALDADGVGELEGAAVFITEGTLNGDKAWTCTTNGAITPGTTATVWAQFGAGTAYVAGAGLTLTGQTIDVVAADASLTVAADSISRAALTGDVTASAGSNATTIANSAVTNAKLANMNGLTIKGNATGSSAAPSDLTQSNMKSMLGYPTQYYSGTVGGATSQVITHNLGNSAVFVQVFRTAAPNDTVECDVERTTANTVTLRFAVAPATNEYSVVVIG